MSRTYISNPSKSGRGNRMAFDERQKKRIATMARDGYAVHMIAESVGCSTKTLTAYAQTYGIVFMDEASVRARAANARKKANGGASA